MQMNRFVISTLVTLVFCSSHSFATVEHFAFPEDAVLTGPMKDFYETNGYIILDDFLNTQTCEELIAETDKIVREQVPAPEDMVIFVPDNAESVAKQGKYFAESADTIRPFFENGAFENGKMVVPYSQSINKIGHALAEKNEKFRQITFTSAVRKLAEQLGVIDPRLNQSMCILKPKKIGGEVTPHQDSTYLYTKPDTTLAFWTSLENATPENACLMAIPGSQRWELFSRYVRNEHKPGHSYVDLEGHPLTADEMTKLYTWPKEMFVPLPMKRGSLILFPGTLVHASGPNKSERSRYAYTFHVISGLADYPVDNWLQRDQFPSIWTGE